VSERLATAEECRPLYELMAKVKTLAPWEWMEETEIFGVQNPDTREPGFVSVMGMAGEHFAVAVYLGAAGIDGFWSMQDAGPFLEPELLLQVPQLQASFDDREILEKSDRDMIKALGLKYRGRNSWPMFRSYRPGYAPYFITADEARFIEVALEQLLDVAPRVQADPELLDQEDKSDYLVRVPKHEGDEFVWRDEIMRIPPPPPREVAIVMDRQLLSAAKKLPKARYEIEADFFLTPMLIGERGERPRFGYTLLLVEASRGMIVGAEVLEPVPDLETMWGELAVTTLNQLVRLRALPGAIKVGSGLLYDMLKPLTDELKIKLKITNNLPHVDAARDGLENFMGL
jgi:hypothetical protein